MRRKVSFLPQIAKHLGFWCLLSCWETIGNDRVKNNEIKACRQKRLIPLCPLVRSDIARNLLRWHFGLRVNRSRSLIPTAIWKLRWGDFSASCEIRPFLPLDDAEPSLPECDDVLREHKTKEQIFCFTVLPSLIPFLKEGWRDIKTMYQSSLAFHRVWNAGLYWCCTPCSSTVHNWGIFAKAWGNYKSGSFPRKNPGGKKNSNNATLRSSCYSRTCRIWFVPNWPN